MRYRIYAESMSGKIQIHHFLSVRPKSNTIKQNQFSYNVVNRQARGYLNN